MVGLILISAFVVLPQIILKKKEQNKNVWIWTFLFMPLPFCYSKYLVFWDLVWIHINNNSLRGGKKKYEFFFQNQFNNPTTPTKAKQPSQSQMKLWQTAVKAKLKCMYCPQQRRGGHHTVFWTEKSPSRTENGIIFFFLFSKEIIF